VSSQENSLKKQPILIIGAGLAGLSTSYHLRVQGLSSHIIEKEPQVGGLSRSFQIKGFTFDFTGHLLHLHTPASKKLIESLLKGNVMLCNRNTWIYSHGTQTRYPFQAYTCGLPNPVVDECILGFHEAVLKNMRRGKTPENFQEWCLQKFGSGISNHFMIPYNEKLFQTPASRMTTEWCGPFVPTPKLEEVVQGALKNESRTFGYNASFLYPLRGGIQALPSALAKKTSPVELGVEVEQVDWRNKVVSLTDGKTIAYKTLVNTMPLTELIDKMRGLPNPILRARTRLRYASILCLNVGLKRARLSDKSWIYFPEEKFPFYRVGFPMNFSPHVAPKGCSSMYIEVPFSRIQGKSKAAILKIVKKGLVECGILRKQDKFLVTQFLPIKHAYVIYDKHRPKALRTITTFLHRHRILSIGRYGGWKYSFMEEAIRDGMEAANKIHSLYGRKP